MPPFGFLRYRAAPETSRLERVNHVNPDSKPLGAEPRHDHAPHHSRAPRRHERFADWLAGARAWHRLVPGLLLVAAGVAVAMLAAQPFAAVSAMLVAIVLGIAVRNLLPLPAAVEPGLAFSARTLLRLGIVLLGLRLSLSDVLALGPKMIITVVAVVAGGIAVGLPLGKVLGVSWRRRMLIAGGFSICGAAAIAAVAGVVGDDDDRKDDGGESGDEGGAAEDMAVSLALVVLFGTLMIPLVPLLGRLFGLGDMATAMWAGASVHEVAQVVAIGGAFGGEPLGAAVVIKLGRVLMLAPVLIWVGWLWRRQAKAAHAGAGGEGGGRASLPPIMPLFVAGFIAMVVLRTLGVVPEAVVSVAGVIEQVLLAAAMFALGTGVKASMFRRVGTAPLAMAFALTVVVAVIGLAGVLWAGA